MLYRKNIKWVAAGGDCVVSNTAATPKVTPRSAASPAWKAAVGLPSWMHPSLPRSATECGTEPTGASSGQSAMAAPTDTAAASVPDMATIMTGCATENGCLAIKVPQLPVASALSLSTMPLFALRRVKSRFACSGSGNRGPSGAGGGLSSAAAAAVAVLAALAEAAASSLDSGCVVDAPAPLCWRRRRAFSAAVRASASRSLLRMFT